MNQPVEPSFGPTSSHGSVPGGIVVDSANVTGVVNNLGVTREPHSTPPPVLVVGHNGDTHFQHHLPIRFTGSGSEYFRIWIVNLLLTLVTLGLYYPWAKVRRLRYFHGNTVVAGHPLGFHANPRKMFRGFALVSVLLVLYSVAQEVSALAGAAAFLIVMALWPALFKSSQQFRLANTSWRGLRFHFTGDLPGAYRAMLPLFVPALMAIAVMAVVGEAEKPPTWVGLLFLATVAVSLLLAPWLWWNLKRYQHSHFALGQLQTELRARPAAFYGVVFKTIGVFLLTVILAASVAGIFGLLGGALSLAGSGGTNKVAVVVATVIGFVVALLLVQLVPRPYFVSRQQNLLWSRTGNSRIRFKSELSFQSLLGLTVKNWLLMAVTLGLYWPFAAIATARLRLESVTLVSRIELDELVSLTRHREGEAAGDAAGDLFGVDVGL